MITIENRFKNQLSYLTNRIVFFYTNNQLCTAFRYFFGGWSTSWPICPPPPPKKKKQAAGSACVPPRLRPAAAGWTFKGRIESLSDFRTPIRVDLWTELVPVDGQLTLTQLTSALTLTPSWCQLMASWRSSSIIPESRACTADWAGSSPKRLVIIIRAEETKTAESETARLRGQVIRRKLVAAEHRQK